MNRDKGLPIFIDIDNDYRGIVSLLLKYIIRTAFFWDIGTHKKRLSMTNEIFKKFMYTVIFALNILLYQNWASEYENIVMGGLQWCLVCLMDGTTLRIFVSGQPFEMYGNEVRLSITVD